MEKDLLLKSAQNGDINSYHLLFKKFHEELKSYIYRLLADRNDMEDITQDTFVKSFDKLSSFKGNSTLKTWVFTIATRLCYDFLRTKNRWNADVLDQAKAIADQRKDVRDYLKAASAESNFDLKEHIDFCFTCISKSLPIEQQVSLLLKDVYEFKIKEISNIIGKGDAAVKHYVRLARETMADIFDSRCALVNKKGICRQCSQLNNWLNPKQKTQESLMNLELVKQSKEKNKSALFELREHLVKNVNPIRSEGSDLHEAFMQLHRLASGDIKEIENLKTK